MYTSVFSPRTQAPFRLDLLSHFFSSSPSAVFVDASPLRRGEAILCYKSIYSNRGSIIDYITISYATIKEQFGKKSAFQHPPNMYQNLSHFVLLFLMSRFPRRKAINTIPVLKDIGHDIGLMLQRLVFIGGHRLHENRTRIRCPQPVMDIN